MSSDPLQLAEEAARAAGARLRAAYGAAVTVMDDRAKDLKISADREAERAIIDRLAQAGETEILSEEAGLLAKRTGLDGRLWVVDPLDGTVNFARGLPLCCVSIGLWANGQPQLGVIYDFCTDTLYKGAVGQGAWRNGRPMTVSDIATPAQGLVATGFPSGASYAVEPLLEFVRRVQAFKKVRLLGSAALSLAQVAAGTIDAYAENQIYFWDVAAGLALVRAAGGTYTMGALDDRWRADVVATNRHLGARV